MATETSYCLTTMDNVKNYLGLSASSTTHNESITRLVRAATDAIETYCGRKFKRRVYQMERQNGINDQELPLNNWPIISIEKIAVDTETAMMVRCTDGGAYAATVSVIRNGDPAANTALRISLKGGANESDATLLYSSNTTISDLVASVNGVTGWSASVQGSLGHYDPVELIPIGGQECLSTDYYLETPYLQLNDYNIDHETGVLYRPGGWNEGFNNIYIDYTAGYEIVPYDLEQVAIRAVVEAFNSKNINPNLKSEKIGDYSYTNFEASTINKAINICEAELDKWRRIEYA